MKFFEYMKQSRERVGLTQTQAAEKIGVSITTIQKWEKDQLPTAQFWGIIIKTYGLNEREFGEKIVVASSSKDSAEKEEEPAFPSFLFSKSQLEELEKMVLTEEEQELLGLECLYGTESSVDREGNTKPNVLPQNLPYEYIKKMNPFRVRQLHQSLEEKLGRNRAFVIEYLTKHPRFLFDIYKLSSEGIKELCLFIRYKTIGFTNCHLDNLEIIYTALKEFENNDESFLIAESDNHTQFLLDSLQNSLFTQNNSNKNLVSKYPQYIHVENRESTDNQYLRRKEYEKSFEHYDHVSYRLCAYATITEEGRQLLSWCKQNKAFDRT